MPTIKTTKGIKREDGKKNYIITTTDGAEFQAVPVKGQKWECSGETFKTVKAVKLAIENGQLQPVDGETPELEPGEVTPELELDELLGEPEVENSFNSTGVFDCADPCCLLVQAVACGNLELTEEIRDTLDSYGWLTEDKQPDLDKMNRELMRVFI